jgi:hypothetical protein
MPKFGREYNIVMGRKTKTSKKFSVVQSSVVYKTTITVL